MNLESKSPTLPVTSCNNNDRCEEVQVIVDRMPTKGATYMAIVVAILTLIAFILSCIISYPDTVDGSISITSDNAPIRLVANSSGQLQFFYSDGDTVQKQVPVACIRNSAEASDVLELERVLGTPFKSEEYKLLESFEQVIGEISGAFNQYLLSLSQYNQHLNSDLYAAETQNLQGQITSDEEILHHVDAERNIRQEVLDLNSNELTKDSLLLVHKAITSKDLDQQRTSYLMASESFWNTESNRATVQARINQNKIKIKQVFVEQKETGEKLFADVLGKRSDLFNQIRVWKEHYLLMSPISGRLEYLGFWRNHGFVRAGEEVVTIIPKQQELFGEVRVPSVGVGKIKVGQPVNVKVNNYPYDEYGIIKGEVVKVSQIPSLMTTKDGDIECYLVLVRFPNGAVTNYGIKLNINFESKGTAEIITKDKKLIERLFDNLKSLGTK